MKRFIFVLALVVFLFGCDKLPKGDVINPIINSTRSTTSIISNTSTTTTSTAPIIYHTLTFYCYSGYGYMWEKAGEQLDRIVQVVADGEDTVPVHVTAYTNLGYKFIDWVATDPGGPCIEYYYDNPLVIHNVRTGNYFSNYNAQFQ